MFAKIKKFYKLLTKTKVKVKYYQLFKKFMY